MWEWMFFNWLVDRRVDKRMRKNQETSLFELILGSLIAIPMFIAGVALIVYHVFRIVPNFIWIAVTLYFLLEWRKKYKMYKKN